MAYRSKGKYLRQHVASDLELTQLVLCIDAKSSVRDTHPLRSTTHLDDGSVTHVIRTQLNISFALKQIERRLNS